MSEHAGRLFSTTAAFKLDWPQVVADVATGHAVEVREVVVMIVLDPIGGARPVMVEAVGPRLLKTPGGSMYSQTWDRITWTCDRAGALAPWARVDPELLKTAAPLIRRTVRMEGTQ